jgi:hypothetical protein
MSNAKRFPTGAVAALFLFLITFVAPARAWAQDPVGKWDGKVELPGGPLEVHLDLKHTDEGWSGNIVIPTESARATGLKQIQVSGRHVTFVVDARGGPAFDGMLEKNGTRLDGTFTQAGFDYPFKLIRAGKGSGSGGVRGRGG